MRGINHRPAERNGWVRTVASASGKAASLRQQPLSWRLAQRSNSLPWIVFFDVDRGGLRQVKAIIETEKGNAGFDSIQVVK